MRFYIKNGFTRIIFRLGEIRRNEYVVKQKKRKILSQKQK